jgi:uncharacterized phiE125 gp8 family phage protein
MSLTLTSPPIAEPVSLSEIKEHLKVDGNAEDALIAGLLLAARQTIEARFQLAVMTQSWRLALDTAPDGAVTLPLSPVVSIDVVGAVRGGVIEALAPSAYDAQAGAVGRVRIKAPLTTDQTLGGIVIAFTAGWPDAASAPEELKLAIKTLTAHFYENREAETTAPAALGALLASYRQVRL